MKQWTVYFRDKNGSKASVVIEAEDRAGVFAELKKRGISAISVEEGASNKKPRKAPSSGASSKGRGLIAAAIVVLVAGVAAWWMWPEEKKVVVVKKGVKEVVKPSVQPEVTKTVEKSREESQSKPKELPPQRIGEVRNGYRLLPSGRLHRVRGVVTSGVTRVSLVDKTFTRHSDRMIAHLLTAEFGGTVVGDSESIFKGFNKDFEESLKEDIVVNGDDTDEVKELKQAVLDARKEILAQIKEGNDAESVLVETRNQLLELTLYREDLEKEVLRLSQDGMTQEEYDELISAANQMLSDRGCKGVQMPRLVADAIQLRLRHEEARQSKNEAARSSEINQ